MHILNQKYLHGTRFQKWKNGPRMEEGVEGGVAVLTISPNDPQGYFVLPILSIMGSTGLEGLISQAGTLPGK